MGWLILLACNPPEPLTHDCGSDRECIEHHLRAAHAHAVDDEAWDVVPLIEDAINENGKR